MSDSISAPSFIDVRATPPVLPIPAPSSADGRPIPQVPPTAAAVFGVEEALVNVRLLIAAALTAVPEDADDSLADNLNRANAMLWVTVQNVNTIARGIGANRRGVR